MKKITVLLGTLALALGFGVAVGAHSAEEAKVASADTSYSIYLEFNNDNWRNGSNKVGIYVWDSSSEHNKFGDLVVPSTHYIEYSISCDFVPANLIMIVVTPEAESLGEWVWNDSDPGLYGRTDNIAWNKVAWVGNYYTSSKWCESGNYDWATSILGGAYEEWTSTTVNIPLSNAHLNSSGELEVYGDVTLEKCQFKAHTDAGDSYWGRYKTQDSISSNFSGGYTGDEGPSDKPGDNIICETAGKYQMYFHYYDKRLWIQMDANEEAKAYAQNFLDTVTCNGSAVTAPDGTWADMKTAFNNMSEAARGVLTNADASKTGTVVEQAVARYDHIVVRYGTTAYEDFMGRIEAGKIVAVSYNATELEVSGSAPIIIIVSAAISLTAIGLVLVLRKKRSIK